MAFTFLHTSDWHIGKPFGRFPDEQAHVLRHARLAAIDRLAEAARTGAAGHVLVAGDLFDRPTLADRERRAPIGQMQAHPDIVWHIIPGNHDPASAGGIWERVLRDGLPANVRVHLETRTVEIAPGVWLLPAPLASKSMARDPTAWMDDATTPAGALRVGLAHGSVQGFGSDKAASIEIAPDRPRRAGLTYLALGDWHGMRQIGSRAAYSGTPEPDGYLDNAPGLALLVRLDGAGSEPVIARREIGAHRWLERAVSTTRTSDLAAIEGEVEGLGAGARRVMLAVEVIGRVGPGEDAQIRRGLDRLEPRVFHLERRLERMWPSLGDDDVERLFTGQLRDVARELSSAAEADASAASETARRALRHLLEIADAGRIATGAGER